MLYITGLRSGNLRLITVRHVQELLASGRTQLMIIKEGLKKHPIVLTPCNLQLLRLCEPRINYLCVHRNHKKRRTDYLFTAQYKSPSEPPSIDIVRRFLNNILREVFLELGVLFTTHSFRIYIITDLLENTPIHNVQKIIGHAKIGSTVVYSRNTVNYAEVEADIDKVRSLEIIQQEGHLKLPEYNNKEIKQFFEEGIT